MAARLHGHGDGGPAPLLPLARQPEKRDWLRALHVAAVLAMVALVVSVVCWLQLDGRRMRQTEADWLEALRRFEDRLRGPRPSPGLVPLRAVAAKASSWAISCGPKKIVGKLFFGQNATNSDVYDFCE